MMKPLPDRIYKFGWPHFRSWSAKKHLATHYGPAVFGTDSVSYQKGLFRTKTHTDVPPNMGPIIYTHMYGMYAFHMAYFIPMIKSETMKAMAKETSASFSLNMSENAENALNAFSKFI